MYYITLKIQSLLLIGTILIEDFTIQKKDVNLFIIRFITKLCNKF